MRLVTGSKLPILQRCQWWARDDVQYTEPERGQAAGRGINIHDGIDTDDLSKVAFEDIAIVQRGRQYLKDLRAAGFTVETEVALALNYVTGAGRRLKSSGHRDYTDLKPNEIGLTVDYLAYIDAPPGIQVNRIIEVGDWKTGYGIHVDKTSENWQLGAAAAALSDMYGDSAITAKIHYLDNEYVDSWTFSAMEAQRFGIWIRNRFELTPQAQPNPGDHCRYCPARVDCPTVKSSIAHLAPHATVLWSLERVSLENDAAMAMALPALKGAVEAVEKALKERSKQGLALPNGKVWKPVLQTRQGYDSKRMAEALGPRAEEFRTKTEYEVFRQVKP